MLRLNIIIIIYNGISPHCRRLYNGLTPTMQARVHIVEVFFFSKLTERELPKGQPKPIAPPPVAPPPPPVAPPPVAPPPPPVAPPPRPPVFGAGFQVHPEKVARWTRGQKGQKVGSYSTVV